MTRLTVRDPFRDARSLMRRSFGDWGPSLWFDEPDGFFSRPHIRHIALPLDVYETEDGLSVEAPLPGFEKDEVSVTLEKGKLSIRAEHSDESDDEKTVDGRTYFVRERHQGAVARSLVIGEGYDGDSVSGSLKEGVLTVTIAKTPEARPKEIEISVA